MGAKQCVVGEKRGRGGKIEGAKKRGAKKGAEKRGRKKGDAVEGTLDNSTDEKDYAL